MADLKRWSTGRLGNSHPKHLNTDHINTYGLDNDNLPGIEGYINEDIVRAWDDNRPVINLLSNDEIINNTINGINIDKGLNAVLRNNQDDWKLTIGIEESYTDPEDFYNVIDVTPLKINKGVAISKTQGTTTSNFKKIIGFKRDDGTTLWIDEHAWSYDTTPILNDPSGTYTGYYRAIYTDVPESSIPTNYEEYIITVRQINTDSDSYNFPIYSSDEFIVPYSSSIFDINDETTDFNSENVEYPGYNHYPDSYVQLLANNLGILEVGEDTKTIKNLRRVGHKLLASDFFAESGVYHAELKSDVFREQKSTNFNRIENDTNFIRVIGGLKKYNETSRIYFDDHKTTLNTLLPIYDNRDFLGSQTYSFEIAKSDQFSGAFKIIEFDSPETRGYIDFGLTVADPDAALGLAANDYDFRIILNNDSTNPPDRTPVIITVTVTGTTTLNQLRDLINAEFTSNDVYAWTRTFDDGGNWEMRVYSKSSGTYSKIAIDDTDISNGYLETALSTSFETPVDAATWAETRWEFSEWPIYQDPSSAGDHQEIVDGSSITTSNFEAETIGRQLTEAMFNAGFRNFTVGLNNTLDDNHTCELYVMSNSSTQGYQELGITIPFTYNDSGLNQLSTYYFKLTIDGAAAEEFNFTTSTDISYAAVVNAINSALSGKAHFEFTGTNDLKFVSDSYGPQSSIQTGDGVTGTNLFGAAYPAAGFPPVTSHSSPVAGTGNTITARARQINTFAIYTDSEKERAYYSHSDDILYITPDTETDIRDYIDTEHAYKSDTSDNRWSTHHDRVIQLNFSGHASGWTADAYITKIYSFITNSKEHLIIGNNEGELFFTDDTNNLYNDDLDIDTVFTKLTDASLNNCEQVNNFFIYEDAANTKRFLFIMSTYRIFFADVWSGLAAGTVFSEVKCESGGVVTNLTHRMFTQINDAVDWQANVSGSVSNKYLIFVGDSTTNLYTDWIYAPILYALYDDSTQTFDWYADEIYRKTQIDNIKSIVKYNGWEDPEQTYQLFITNNANGPEIWTGNSQNNDTDIGGGGDDRFARFSWVEANYENSNDHLEIDDNISTLNYIEVFDNRIFIGGTRSSSTIYGGFYSYALNKLQKYFKRDAYSAYYDSSADVLYATISNGALANSDPCILKVSEELDDGRCQLTSKAGILQFNLYSDSSFRIILQGFNVGGVNYDDGDIDVDSGGYNIVFDASAATTIQDVVDAINGDDINADGFKTAYREGSGIQVDLTPVIRARAITDYEKFGDTYSDNTKKIIIESKTADPGEGSGHTNTQETTQTDCAIKLLNPTQGTSILGTGVGTIEMDIGDYAETNLQLLDWNSAECYQLRRVSSSSFSFGGNTYVSISSAVSTGYQILVGSLRIKTNSTNELGFSQGRGQIISGSTATGLPNDSTTFTFKVTFDAGGTPVVDNISFAGSAAQTMTDLLSAINNDLTGGTASLQTIGGTAEYCDIVITSATTGDDSSILIEEDSSGTYLFSRDGLDIIPNTPIPGSTTLVTEGTQTFGFTWENADYFLVPYHPTSHDFRIYIPNGSTRVDTGDTIWLDFWMWKMLTKVAAKVGGADNLPLTGEWTYELEGKRIVVKDTPNTIAPEDIYFVDVKTEKVLKKVDLGTIVPSTQTELSDEFHASQPQNLSNSDISLSRPLARISALHYGIALWSTDTTDPITTDYSFFLPRIDLVRVNKNINDLGNRIDILKGAPDPDLPYVNLPLLDQDQYNFLYTIFVNSQDYNQNNISRAPYYSSDEFEKGRIYLDGNIHYFKSENELISTRGLTPLKDIEVTKKEVVNADYELVKILDPVGVNDYRKRNQEYSNLDYSECIFLDPVNGSDISDGLTRSTPVKTLAQALTLCSAIRSNIVIIKNINLTIPTLANATISKTFGIRLIAEHVATIDQLTLGSEVYLQGIKITTHLKLANNHNLNAKYCQFKKIITDTTVALDNITVRVDNSIIEQEGLLVSNAGTHDINGAISVAFNNVYISDDAQLLNFNPNSYDTTATNTFTFTNITNAKTSTLGSGRKVIITPYSTSLTISIVDSILPYDPTANETLFDSDAIVTITRSLLYLVNNAGTGSIVNDNSTIVLGTSNEIDIHTNGASVSIARGDSADSLALKYVDRINDAGAFIEKRFERGIENYEENSSEESILKLDDQRIEYRSDLVADHFTYWLRFKPADSYQTSGILFDSRYSQDYDSDTSTFNLNGADFIQIVYDNKTYGTNYLSSDNYCFKLIISNSLTTTISVIGPYFNSSNNFEYAQWHELGVVLEQSKTYNPKYDYVNISDGAGDYNRIQAIIYTVWDRDIDRVYAPKNNLFEDSAGSDITTSNWHLGDILSTHFNLGGGWTSTWTQTISGYEWSTWTPSTYSMLVDKLIVSRDLIPVNIVKEFGTKTIIDIKETNYNAPRLDDKNSTLIVQCNNSHPYSDNGVEPFRDYKINARYYEGLENHAIAIEDQHTNLLTYGKFDSDTWYDRREAHQWSSVGQVVSKIWDAEPAISTADPTNELVIVLLERDGNVYVEFVNYTTYAVSDSTMIVASDTLLEGWLTVYGSYVVITYIKSSDNKAYFRTIAITGHAISSECTIDSNTADHVYTCRGHDNDYAAFAFHDSIANQGYAKVMNITTGADVHAKTAISDGDDISYVAIAETMDQNGNETYTIFYTVDPSNNLNYTMYSSNLSTVILSHDTLISSQTPTDLQALVLPNGNFVIKWKDYNAGTDSPINFSIKTVEGKDIISNESVFTTNAPENRTDDMRLVSGSNIMFVNQDDTSKEITYSIFDGNGIKLNQSDNIRNFTEKNFLSFALGTSYITNELTLIGAVDTDSEGWLVNSENELPIGWYRDFTGTYDEFTAETYETRTLFGDALHVRFNHIAAADETGEFIGNAETNDLSQFSGNDQTDGTISATAGSAMHGDYGYEFEYDGTGPILYLEKTGISGNAYTYARFYIKINSNFVLSGSDPKRIEICQFGPGGVNNVIVELELNTADGKFKLRASHSVAGTDTTAISVINYGVEQYIDIAYLADAIHPLDGGYKIAVDGVEVIDQTGVAGMPALGTPVEISIGSQSGSHNPTSGSKFYIDDVRVEAFSTEDDYIGEFTVGYGQGDIWSRATITNSSSKHYISGVQFIQTGTIELKLTGTALDDDIVVQFNEDGTYSHETENDNLTDIDIRQINFNGIKRFAIGFTVDNIGYVDVHIKSMNSDEDSRIDEFLIDNVKIEANNWPTSIDANETSLLYYPTSMKKKGNIFLRVTPEFLYNDSNNHSLVAGRAVDDTGTVYVTHELFYEASSDHFKFLLRDNSGNTVSVESGTYGVADVAKKLTDLNERKTIVVNWDVDEGLLTMYIDETVYEASFSPATLVDFKPSIMTFIGGRPDGTAKAESLYSLIRVGDEPITSKEVEIFRGKMNPFLRSNNNNVGDVIVNKITFSGVDASDEGTIYTEVDDLGNTSLVVEIADDFDDKFIIRHQGGDLAIFGSGCLEINGIIKASVMEIDSTTTLTTFDDHITVRYGFSGTPPEFNDGYFEVERGTETNAEIRFDESQDAWILKDGTNNNISIDGTHIGTWKSDQDFNLVANGTSAITFSTGSSTDGGSGDGTQNRTDGTERLRITPTTAVFNEDGLDYDFRVESNNEEYMIFVNAGDDRVLIGRGTTEPTAGNLVVNHAITIQQGDDASYGYIEFRNDSGDRAGYIGNGNGSNTWEIVSELTNFIIQGDDIKISALDVVELVCSTLEVDTIVEMKTGNYIAWEDDLTNAKIEYTDDALNYANESQNGVAQIVEISFPADTARSLSGKYWNLSSVNEEYYIWYYIDDGEYEITEITCPGSTAGALSETYWYLNSPNDEFYVWYHVVEVAEITGVACYDATNSFGKYWTISAPEGNYYVWYDDSSYTYSDPQLLNRIGIRIEITAGWTSDQVATQTATTLNATPQFTVPAPGTDIITVTNVTAGSVTNASIGNGAVDSVIVITNGLNESVDPNIAGRVGIRVDLAYTDSATNVANKTATAITALADFTASFLSDVVTVTNDYKGHIDDASNQTTGVSVNVTQQGITPSYDPGDPSNAGQVEMTTISCTADVSKSHSGKYWTLNSKTGVYYVWYNILGNVEIFNAKPDDNDAGQQFGKYFVFYANNVNGQEIKYYVWYDDSSYTYTDPQISSAYGIRVEIIDAETAVNVAAKTAIAINSYSTDFMSGNVSDVFTVTMTYNGNVTNPDSGDVVWVAGPNVTTPGVDDSTDPKVANKSGIEVIIIEDETAANVATKTKNVLDAMYEFNSTNVGAALYVETAAPADVTDATGGDLAWTINVSQQGINPSTGGTAVGTGIQVTIIENETNQNVAEKTKDEIDALSDFGATRNSNIITITNAHKGEVLEPSDRDAGVSINVTTPGTSGNSKIHGIGVPGAFAAHRIYNAVWNDLAEGFDISPTSSDHKPGYVYVMTDQGIELSSKRADKAVVGVYSDTYGFCLGSGGIGIKDSRIPIGLSGKVKVWIKEPLEIGDMLVSYYDGFATKATEEERKDRGIIIGKVLESSYDNKPKRIWILI